MEKDKFYRHPKILAPLILGVALGITPGVKAQEPFCTPDDLCVEVSGRVTGYTPRAPDGIETGQCEGDCERTASGDVVMFGRTAACPVHVPFDVQVYIESVGKADGRTYVCQDHGDMGKTDVDIAVNHENDNAGLYTDLNATITFKYHEGPVTSIYPEVNIFTREYQHQPRNNSTQIPSLSR